MSNFLGVSGPLSSRARALALALASCLCLLSVEATASAPGAGTTIDSDAVFAGGVGGEGHGYFVIAYRLSDGSGTRVFARKGTAPLGIAPFDDVVLPLDVLSISEVTSGIWALELNATLPNIGEITLRAVSDQIDMTGKGCQGTANYYLHSTSSHLTEYGNVFGSIGGYEIQSWACMAWGWDVSGAYEVPPLSQGM